MVPPTTQKRQPTNGKSAGWQAAASWLTISAVPCKTKPIQPNIFMCNLLKSKAPKLFNHTDRVSSQSVVGVGYLLIKLRKVNKESVHSD